MGEGHDSEQGYHTPAHTIGMTLHRERLRQVFAGRQGELRRTTEAMGRPEYAGIAMIGEEGVGKSRLLTELAGRADPRRYAVVRAAAIQVTATVHFGALAEYLPAGLLSSPFTGNALRVAADELLGLAGQRRLVLVNDDAQLLDEASVALAYQMAVRGEMFILTTVRRGHTLPHPIGDLWTSGLAEWIEIDCLTRQEVEDILVETLAGSGEGHVDGLLVQRFWEATGGNALLLRELLAAQMEAGTLAPHQRIWRLAGPFAIPSWLVALVEGRLRSVPPESRPALELLAFGEPLSTTLLSQLVPPAALEAAEAHGAIRVEHSEGQDRARLAYPLYGDVLRAATPRLRAQRWRNEYASLVEANSRGATDLARVAGWRLASGAQPRTESLAAAAGGAWSMLDLRLAEDLGRRATTAGQGTAVAEPLGYSLLFAGRPDEAEVELAALGTPSEDADRARLAGVRAFNLFFGLDRVSEADAMLRSTAAEVSDRAMRSRLLARRALLLAFAGRCDRALDLAATVPDEPEARVASGLSLAFTGRPDDGIKALTEEWAAEPPWLGTFADLGLVHAYLWTGRLAQAQERARRAYDRAIARRWHFGIAVSCLLRGLVAATQGDVRDEMRRCREGIAITRDHGPSGLLAVLLGRLAHSQALAGDAQPATASLAEADRLAKRSMGLLAPWIELARTWVGTPSAERAERTARLARAARASGFEAMALHDVVRLGSPDRVVSRLRELAVGSVDRTVELYASHACAAVAGDDAALAEVSARFERLGSPILAAEVAAEESARHRRGGRQALASAAAARTLMLASRGAGMARTPALLALETPQITRRQNEIAELAVSGLSSREISARLVLSVRTVENHLQRVYRKLGIGTRAELGALRALLSEPAGS